MTSLLEPAEASGQAAARARLAGRRVLVVGAGTARYEGQEEGKIGNGRAIATLVAREGGSVACADRDAHAAQATADLIAEDSDGRAQVLEADVADPDACRRLVVEAADALGGLDGVVLNVGILGPFGLAGTAAEDWDRLFHVNVRSHALLATHALDTLEDGSSIAFMSSMSALLPGIGRTRGAQTGSTARPQCLHTRARARMRSAHHGQSLHLFEGLGGDCCVSARIFASIAPELSQSSEEFFLRSENDFMRRRYLPTSEIFSS